MAQDLNRQLQTIEATLTAQNLRLDAVKAALQELPPHTSLELTRGWKDAFEEAVDVQPLFSRPSRRSPAGAIRA